MQEKLPPSQYDQAVTFEVADIQEAVITPVWLRPSERNATGERLLVLTNILTTPEGSACEWAEGEAKYHTALYRAAGKPDNCMVEVGAGDDTILVGGRYDEKRTVEEVGLRPRLLLATECTSEQMARHARTLLGVAQATEIAARDYFRWSDGTSMEIELLRQDPGTGFFRPVSLLDIL